MAATFKIEQQKDFTIMANHHLRNKNLSLKAKGLQSLMLSLPPTWDYTLKGLSTICGDGVDSISSALKELENAGYVVRKRLRNGQGRLCGTEYIIYQIPQETAAESVEDENRPKRENPVLVKADKKKSKQKTPEPIQQEIVQKEKGETEPAREKPVQVKPKQEKPVQEKRLQLNIQELNTKILSTNQSICLEFEAEVRSNSELDRPTDEIADAEPKEDNGLSKLSAYSEVCKNEFSARQTEMLFRLMSFVNEQQRLSYFQHIYTRLEYQAGKSGKKIVDRFAYLVQIIKNDYTQLQQSNEQKSKMTSHENVNVKFYGGTYDLAAYENADPFADDCFEEVV